MSEKNYEAALKDLCIEVIFLLEQYKEKGLITEEEYQLNVAKKKEFLSHIS